MLKKCDSIHISRTEQNNTAEPAGAAKIYSSVLNGGNDGPVAGDAGYERTDPGDHQQRHPVVHVVNRLRSLQEQGRYQDPEEERAGPHPDPRHRSRPEPEVASHAKLLLPFALRSRGRTDEELDVLVRFLIRVDAVHLAKQRRGISLLFVAVVVVAVIPSIRPRFSIWG